MADGWLVCDWGNCTYPAIHFFQMDPKKDSLRRKLVCRCPNHPFNGDEPEISEDEAKVLLVHEE